MLNSIVIVQVSQLVSFKLSNVYNVLAYKVYNVDTFNTAYNVFEVANNISDIVLR